MKRFTILLCSLFLLFGSLLFAEDENVYSGKAHNNKMTGVERVFKGELVCLGCNLKKSGARTDCQESGHNIRLIAENGSYLTLLSNRYSEKLLTDTSMLYKPIEIKGFHFANAHAIDLISYSFNNKSIGWCTVCQKMDNCSQK